MSGKLLQEGFLRMGMKETVFLRNAGKPQTQSSQESCLEIILEGAD